MPGEDIAERQCGQQDQDKQVDNVRTNVFEDVSAAQYSHQIIVSTNGDLISATRVSAETAATQWAGQMSEDTLQQLSRDRGSSSAVPPKGGGPQDQKAASFEDCYGAGQTLKKVSGA